jgi:hypothetical protein
MKGMKQAAEQVSSAGGVRKITRFVAQDLWHDWQSGVRQSSKLFTNETGSAGGTNVAGGTVFGAFKGAKLTGAVEPAGCEDPMLLGEGPCSKAFISCWTANDMGD